MPCRWCGKPFEEHRVQAHPRFQPRMPCLGLRSGYLERDPQVGSEDRARPSHTRPESSVFDDDDERT